MICRVAYFSFAILSSCLPYSNLEHWLLPRIHQHQNFHRSKWDDEGVFKNSPFHCAISFPRVYIFPLNSFCQTLFCPYRWSTFVPYIFLTTQFRSISPTIALSGISGSTYIVLPARLRRTVLLPSMPNVASCYCLLRGLALDFLQDYTAVLR